MWLISNGDLNTVTKMVLVDNWDEMVPAVRAFCIGTRTHFDNVVINPVGPADHAELTRLRADLQFLNGR
jgi:hypothetical protein